MWAVSVSEKWDDGTWEFVGYVKVFRDRYRALDFALRSIKESLYDRYYDVERMSEEVVRAGGLTDLIES